jgi:hypothetical protein
VFAVVVCVVGEADHAEIGVEFLELVEGHMEPVCVDRSTCR